MKPGCCKDKTTTLKSSDDLKTSAHLVLKAPSTVFISNLLRIMTVAAVHFPATISPGFDRPPPGKPKIEAYLLHRAFLI